MTFGEARDILRRDVLAEASTDYYTNDDLFYFLLRSATETAATFGFPTAIASQAVAAGASAFTLPSDAITVDVHEVAFNGFPLALAPYRTVLEYGNSTLTGLPRFYNFDPKRGGLVLIAPPVPAGGGTVSFEYVQRYSPPFDGGLGVEIWNGLFSPYHELVVWTAGAKAFDASLETERSQYASQKAAGVAQALALFLNKAHAHRVLVPEVAES